ncbi:AMP-binding protein [Nonomuraea fuscirosea]|uniref:AMP-binding protein n=1 Tax=Nonomuraea fuscirosea TaxID=1291556 RepID=UPI003434418B
MTVFDRLRDHARERPEALAFSFWHNGELRETCTYEILLADVEGIAGVLAAQGVRPGQRVVLVLPNDLTFVRALLACVAIGAIAVPAPTPLVSRTAAFQERLSRIVSDCTPELVVAPREWFTRIGDHIGPARVVAAEDLGEGAFSRATHPVAFLQYTSGSTSAPRGVVVTHESITVSCEQAAEVYRETTDDVAVTWVPLYHDMGLVTGVLRPLHTGYHSVLMSPDEFVRAPASWLDALAHCGGTLTSAPNFAYDLCVRKVDAAAVAQWDLSRWRVARNAGEVVSAATLSTFSRHFAAARFSSDAMCPSYGLAEATLTVTSSPPGDQPVTATLDAASMEAGLVVLAEDGRVVVSSGRPLRGTEVTIDAEDGRHIGEIIISGGQLSPGYWPMPDRGSAVRRTGDLGFLLGDQLFILGRIDDVLVTRGRKFYLADIAAACRDVTGIRPGRFAVVGLPESADVVMVAEVSGSQERARLEALAGEVTAKITRALQLPLTAVGFVAAGALPVTTSGKVRISAVRRAFVSGRLPLLHLTHHR